MGKAIGYSGIYSLLHCCFLTSSSKTSTVTTLFASKANCDELIACTAKGNWHRQLVGQLR